MNAGQVYLDTSALAKLVVHEPESAAVLAEVVGWGAHVTSEIAVTELFRAVRRMAPASLPRATAVLGDVTLIRLHRSLLDDAGRLSPAGLRSLDAIHVVTARASGTTTMITYDRRMAAAAREDGFNVLSPGTAI